MAKKSDLSDLMKKFDIGGVIDNIKTMVNPAGGTPDVDPSDDLGLKVAEISTLLQEMAKVNQQQTKDLQKANQLLNALFKDVEVLRTPNATEEADDGSVDEAPKAPVKKAKPAKKPAAKKKSAKKK